MGPPCPGAATPAAPRGPPGLTRTGGLLDVPRAAGPAPLPSLLPRIRQHKFCSRTFGDFWSGVAILARDGPGGPAEPLPSPARPTPRRFPTAQTGYGPAGNAGDEAAILTEPAETAHPSHSAPLLPAPGATGAPA